VPRRCEIIRTADRDGLREAIERRLDARERWRGKTAQTGEAA
jgi:hypothetical protein